MLNSARLLGLLAPLLLVTGCDVVATADLPVVQDDRIVGEWMGPDELGLGKPPTERVIIKRSGTNYIYGTADEYAKGNTSVFALSKIGNIVLILDAKDKGKDPSDVCREVFHNTSGTCRTLLGRVDISQDVCTLRMFDSRRIALDSLANAIQIPHEIHKRMSPDGGFKSKSSVEILLTADTKGLESFLGTYLPAHPSIYKRADTYKRAK